MIESTILSLITFLKYLDTTATLAINGLHCTYLDNFMMMYSGRFIWIPLYLSLLIIMLRNFPLRVNIACILVTIALVTINDQVSSTLIRPFIARLRPSNLLNPISQYIHIVDGYRGGSYGFLQRMLLIALALPYSYFMFSAAAYFQRSLLFGQY